jgi:hypothetical protein
MGRCRMSVRDEVRHLLEVTPDDRIEECIRTWSSCERRTGRRASGKNGMASGHR